MDNLVNWLKESGFGDAAGAVMLAMRWKSKAFGGGKKKGQRHFGSIRIAPGGSVADNLEGLSAAAKATDKSNDEADEVASALKDAQADAMKEMADAMKIEEDPVAEGT